MTSFLTAYDFELLGIIVARNAFFVNAFDVFRHEKNISKKEKNKLYFFSFCDRIYLLTFIGGFYDPRGFI